MSETDLEQMLGYLDGMAEKARDETLLLALHDHAPKLWAIMRSHVPEAGCIPGSLVSAALLRRWGITAVPVVMRGVALNNRGCHALEDAIPFLSSQLPGGYSNYSVGRDRCGIQILKMPAIDVKRGVENLAATRPRLVETSVLQVGFLPGDRVAGGRLLLETPDDRRRGLMWAGHLVTVAYAGGDVSPWLIDLSVSQATRAEKNMKFRPFAIPVAPDVQTAGAVIMQVDDLRFSVMAYIPNPGELSWHKSPYYARPESRAEMSRLVSYCDDYMRGIGDPAIDAALRPVERVVR